MPVDAYPFDPAEHLTTDEGRALLVADAFASGEAAYIKHALNTLARARGMTDLAKEAGVTREALYKALGARGDPRLSTLLGIVNALGFQLSATQRAE